MMIRNILFIYLTFSILLCNAQVNIDSVLHRINISKSDTQKINIRIRLASSLRTSNPDTSLKILNAVILKSKEINFIKGEANAYHVKGMVLNLQARYDSAITCFYRSILLLKKIKEKKGIGASYFNIGLVHYNRGDFDKALQYYLLSSKIDQELGDELNKAITLNNIGLLYWGQSQLDKAKTYFEAALKTHIKFKEYKGIAGSLANIGGIWYYKGNFKKAKEYFLMSLENYRIINDVKGINTIYNNLGEICLEEKNYEESIKYQLAAYSEQKKIKDLSGQMYSLMGISKTYLETRNTGKAIEYAARAALIGEQTGSKRQLIEAYKLMADAYVVNKKFEPAYKSLFKYTTLKDSLYGKEASEKLAEAETRYETEKSKKEVAILTAEKKVKSAQLSRQKFITYVAFGGGSILLVISMFAIYAYVQKRKSNRELEIKNAEINLKNEELNQQNEEISAQRDEIDKQKSLVEERNNEVIDSIRYAKRLQEAILQDASFIKAVLPDHFILFKPKDIVSGDFYWVDQVNNKKYFAAADCTGHGVPGAFMSIVCFNLLKHAIHEHGKTSPGAILDQINKDLSDTLKQTLHDSIVKDGMDIALCCYDETTGTLEYAGANNGIYILTPQMEQPGPLDFELKEYKADKRPIGIFMGEELNPFRNNVIKVNKNDVVYLSTDGFADQFGGIANKKFKYKQFEDLLMTIAYKEMSEQKSILNNVMRNWMGNNEQVDDICIIGIKIV